VCDAHADSRSVPDDPVAAVTGAFKDLGGRGGADLLAVFRAEEAKAEARKFGPLRQPYSTTCPAGGRAVGEQATKEKRR
jgi:hypothetical protein